MSTPDPVIEVTLKCVDSQDDFPERKLVLGPSTRIAVGRCSKSAHKQLFAAVDNLYIDSPVISRDHAVLTTNMSTSVPLVYIKDKGSMHGTTVNQVLLSSDREHKLNNGDTVQFGADVMRDTDSYFAKKYRFESRILPLKAKAQYPSSFPTSFTVPDVTSSDEEEDLDDIDDVEVEPKDMSSPPRPGYGSQTNPVNVDDYEDVPAEFLDFDGEDSDSEVEVEIIEAKLVAEPLDNKTNNDSPAKRQKEQSPSPNAVSHSIWTSAAPSESKDPEPASAQQTSSEENTSDEEEDPSQELPQRAGSIMSGLAEDGSEDSEEDHMCEDESDRVSNDGSEQSVDSVKEDLDTIRRLKMEEMLNHAAQGNHVDRGSPTVRASSSQVPPMMPRPARRSSPQDMFGFQTFKAAEAEKGMFDIFQDGPFSDGAMQSPPAPPRPTAPCAPMIWAAPATPLPGPASDFGPIHHHNPWFEDSPTLHMHTPYTLPNPPEGFNSFNRAENFSSPNYFTPSSRPYVPQMSSTFPENRIRSLPKQEHLQMNRPQTPEALKRTNFPTPPNNVQEERAASPLPTRRTKVSIPEIVEGNSEEQQEQPPTPTSMKGLKRKADEMEESAVVENVPAAEPEPKETEVSATAAVAPAPISIVVPEAASLVAERPKKRLRTALANAGYLATGMALGAAGVFGALLAIPDSFLQ